MAGYTRDFLIDAFMSRYFEILETAQEIRLRESAEILYDKKGKDKFREYASLDAAAIRKYKTEFKI
jgi:hypothetical protein